MTQYETKDSGQREEFGSGAVRDVREGKGRYDLISFLALPRIAGVYERGAAKYADRNWEAGMPISRCIDSALRHIAQYMTGYIDEDHLAQAAWNLIAALHFDEGIATGIYPQELDDRPQYATTADEEKRYGDYSDETKAALMETFAGIPHSEGVQATLDELREEEDKLEERNPMREVHYSSIEQWKSQTTLHDPNHSESEGVWHFHDEPEGPDIAYGPAYPCKPADEASRPHRHREAA